LGEAVSFLFSTTQANIYLWLRYIFASLFELHCFCKFVLQISEGQISLMSREVCERKEGQTD
jgi:hypothetical protein